jgi:hypothetical protein
MRIRLWIFFVLMQDFQFYYPSDMSAIMMAYYYFSIGSLIVFLFFHQMLLLVRDHRDCIEVFQYLIQVMERYEIINEDNVELYEK